MAIIARIMPPLCAAGSNFGAVDVSGTARLAGASCSTSTWSAVTHIRCVTLGATAVGPSWSDGGAPPPAVVTVGGVGGTAVGRLSYDAPVVSSVGGNMPGSGGSQLSVLGLGFAVSNLTTSARFGREACMTSTWTSATVLQCQTSVLSRGGAGHTEVIQ